MVEFTRARRAASIAAGIAKADATESEKLVDAFAGLKLDSVFGPVEFRAIDHQST